MFAHVDIICLFPFHFLVIIGLYFIIPLNYVCSILLQLLFYVLLLFCFDLFCFVLFLLVRVRIAFWSFVSCLFVFACVYFRLSLAACLYDSLFI